RKGIEIMKNKNKGLWILIAVTIVVLMVNPRTIKYLKAKTNLDKGRITIIKEVETPHSNQIIYERLDNELIKYQGGVLALYNMTGEQLWSVNLSINRPVIKTNSNSIYIVDENKNQILRINKKGEQVYKSPLDKNYKNFSVCDDNYVVLHYGTENPIQCIVIINDKGKKVSETILGEGEITNIAVSKACDRMAISTININKDSLENNILIYDLKANLLSSQNFRDKIILNIFYNEKGNLIAIDEKNIFSISEDNSTNWKTDFSDPITIINTKNRDHIITYSKGSNRNSIIYSPTENTIKTLSHDGKLFSEIKQGEEVINIDSYKNDIITCSLRTIFKYNKNGNLKMEYPYTADVLKCFALSDDNIAVITKEKISFLSFKEK
ncbi:MAG TPA: DUF5711 family protein, partial [Clostridia bacterium]|nr:DUF5711 family protein [Clostridia bacterium]